MVVLVEEAYVRSTYLGIVKIVYGSIFFIPTSTGFRQNIGTPTGRLGKIIGLFPYYDIYLQVLKLDGLAVIFPTKPYLGV